MVASLALLHNRMSVREEQKKVAPEHRHHGLSVRIEAVALAMLLRTRHNHGKDVHTCRPAKLATLGVAARCVSGWGGGQGAQV